VALALVTLGCSLLPFGRPTPTSTPAPTATAAPVTDTPVPAPTPNYLFFDSFTDPNSGWPTISTGTTKAGYHPPDAYHLELTTAGAVLWVYREQDLGDFSAELQVYLENAGETGEWRHGLVFRRTGEESFYAFTINPRAKTWQALKRTAATASAARLVEVAAKMPAQQAGGAWTTLAEGGNDSILVEPKAVNTLRVDAQGPNLTFSINGQGVVALTEGDFASGDFGFVLETFDQALVHVHFDELAVLPFDPATVPAAPTLAVTPTETGTPTETPTFAAGTQAQATFNATSFVATSAALGTIIPPGATLACGVPGVPCPGTIVPPDVGTFVPPAVGTLIPNIAGSLLP
jgi:hypothetical protein